jgi:V8-like Glu-specific endopeptidase
LATRAGGLAKLLQQQRRRQPGAAGLQQSRARRGTMRQCDVSWRPTAAPASLAAAVCLLLFLQPALCRVQTARRSDLEQAARRRSDLEEMVQTSIGLVPEGYAKAGHWRTGWNLTRQDSSGGGGHQGHSTVMFTAEGSVYTKPVEDNSHLPRRLSEIRTYAENASASLNPDLACESCPTTDTRVMVSDTTETPWDAIGLLARQDANSISNGIAQCSGALIGVQRQHVLTAGHCLVDSSQTTGNVDKITFYPGLSGSDLPFGTLTAIKARVLRQYVEERSVTPLALNYDFALITLSNAAPVGTSYLDIAAGSGTVTFDLTTAGYPADKSGQDMWKVNCTNVEFDFTNGPPQLGCGSSCDNIVVHDCLSYEGQSGSAIWSTEGNNRTVRAVLTGALQESDGTTYNVATQMNAFVYNTVVGWYNEDVTDGLTLAPPAPPASSRNNGGGVVTLGNTSWWRDHWWWIVLPVGVVVVLALISLLVTCLRRGCCGGKRSRPIVGASYPPAYGAGYPNQAAPQYQNGGQAFPQQAYNQAQQTYTPNPNGNTNWERYGPAYYNGAGTSGSPWPADAHQAPPTGYPAARY